VESAIRAAFRMTHQNVLFPTLNQSRKLLAHFRFVAHSFVTTLSAYIFDVAIGGNFDAFLARVTACRLGTSSEFTDVFSVAEAHSAVLNDILSACLMRSAQRAAGDLLRGSLELILEFCVMIGDLNDGRLQECQASSVLDVLFAAFREKMSTLVWSWPFYIYEASRLIPDFLIADQSLRGLVGEGFEIIATPGTLTCIAGTKRCSPHPWWCGCIAPPYITPRHQ